MQLGVHVDSVGDCALDRRQPVNIVSGIEVESQPVGPDLLEDAQGVFAHAHEPAVVVVFQRQPHARLLRMNARLLQALDHLRP